MCSTISDDAISPKDLKNLLNLLSNTLYTSRYKNEKHEEIENKCNALFVRDYPDCITVTNENGKLSSCYPSRIIIPQQDPKDKSAKKLNGSKLKDLISKARVARCRARFPVPVIMYKNKYICRSSTLSVISEIIGRSVYDRVYECVDTFNDYKNMNGDCIEDCDEQLDDDEYENALVSIPRSFMSSDTSQTFSKVRSQDIKLLKFLSVTHICDLMLENKKVKFGLHVSSSEKADKENRYSEFNIISLPYPGCEFFQEYQKNQYNGDGLFHDWKQTFMDSKLDIPKSDDLARVMQINFDDYRQWDVNKLTQTYLKILLHYIKENDSSILIHCISGWDRTPMFVSLLRLSLWADGEIHKTLSALEITYLTVAYDWFLFGHNLKDRLSKGEEIMFFCFQFLKYITGPEFSINNLNCDNPFETDNREPEINADTLSNGDGDFVLAHGSNSYGGSSVSLNSNSSIVSHDRISFLNDSTVYALSSSPSSQSNGYSADNIELSSMVICDNEMTSTLTSSDPFQCSPILSTSFKSSDNNQRCSKPVEIPNSNILQNRSSTEESLNQCNSWQFVSHAGSLRDTSFSNTFSSPESIRSRESANNHHSTRRISEHSNGVSRKDKLLQVRSLFHSMYTTYNHKTTGKLSLFGPRGYCPEDASPD